MTCVHEHLGCRDCGELVPDVAPLVLLQQAEKRLRSEGLKSEAAKREAAKLLGESTAADDVVRIGDEWAARFSPRSTAHRDGSSGGAKAIHKALKWFPADDLVKAFDGALRDDWFMGRNPKTQGKKFTGIGSLLKDEDRIRRFIDLADTPLSEFVPEPGSRVAGELEQLRERLRVVSAGREQDRELIRELVVAGKAARFARDVAVEAIAGLRADAEGREELLAEALRQLDAARVSTLRLAAA